MSSHETSTGTGGLRFSDMAQQRDTFRAKVRDYRKPTSHSQNELAASLSLHPAVLSNKLNGTNSAYLTNPEVKQIILTLAEWQAITERAEAVELLQLMGLSESSFSEQEWRTPPLSRLDVDSTPRPPLNPPSALPAIASAPSQPMHNLPTPSTPLVGREAEIAAILRLLHHSGVRLVTLTGPGGIGKSRLALRVASDMLDDFAAGVWWVELAAITDPALVPQAIARSLDLPEDASHSRTRTVVEVLTDYLRDKHCLLVLDNFEGVAAAAPVVTTLLAHAPNLKVLVTSRLVLRLHGEHEFDVPPLTLPGAQDVTDVAKVAQSEAIMLFQQRARAIRPDFAITSENVADIAAICYRLDGLPLAIELAVARLKLLMPHALLARLTGADGQTTSLSLLTRGNVGESARHQTIRNTIEWSYSALSSDEQRLFRRLAVFEAAFRLETAEAVVADTEPGENMLSVMSLLDGFASLLDHSLLRRIGQNADEERFAYLETIKEYAREKLAEQNEAVTIHARHAAYCLELAEKVEREQTGPHMTDWYNRLESELPDVRAALAWLLRQPGSAEMALRLSIALGRFWLTHNHFSEGRRWLDRCLAANESAPPSLLARAYNHAASLANIQGDYDQAKTHATRALHIWRELNDSAGIAQALNNLGNVAKEQSDFPRAQALYEESLALNRQLNNIAGTAIALNNLGNILLELQDYDEAAALYEESLALKRQIGYSLGVARSLTNLGFATLLKGAPDRAIALYEESLELYAALGDRDGAGLVYYNLGEAALYQKDYSRAHVWLQRSLKAMWELDNPSSIPRCFEGLAQIAAAEGHAETAVRLLGKASAMRAGFATSIPVTEQTRYNETLQTMHSRLSVEAFDRAWQHGQDMPLDRAVAFALEQA